MEYVVSEKNYPEQTVVYIRRKASLYEMGKIIRELFSTARSLKRKPAGTIFSIYYEKPEDPKSVDYEMCLPVQGQADAEGLKKIGGEKCAYLRVKGSYKQFEQAYGAVGQYVESKGYKAAAPPREVYVRGPLLGFLTFIPTMITDIYFPVE